VDVNDTRLGIGLGGVQGAHKLSADGDTVIIIIGYVYNLNSAKTFLNLRCDNHCTDQDHQAKSEK
jgi:hypothetical protein